MSQGGKRTRSPASTTSPADMGARRCVSFHSLRMTRTPAARAVGVSRHRGSSWRARHTCSGSRANTRSRGDTAARQYGSSRCTRPSTRCLAALSPGDYLRPDRMWTARHTRAARSTRGRRNTRGGRVWGGWCQGRGRRSQSRRAQSRDSSLARRASCPTRSCPPDTSAETRDPPTPGRPAPAKRAR